MTDTDPRDPAAVDAEAGSTQDTVAPEAPDARWPQTRAVLVRAGGYLLSAIAGGIVVLVILAATGWVGDGTAGKITAATPAPSPIASTGSSAGGGAAPVLGDPSAPILVEIWADYQCPYCGVLSHAIEPTIERELVETGRIRLVYRDFAFLGEESAQAAAAARCAGQQGAYWRYHDLLFASQQGENRGAFSAENLVQLANFGGLDTKAFAACMDAGETRTAALAETDAGRKLGVESTPTLNIVGSKGQTLIRGLTGFAAIETAIEQVTNGTVPSPTPEPAASSLASPATSPAAGGTAPASSPSGSAASSAP